MLDSNAKTGQIALNAQFSEAAMRCINRVLILALLLGLQACSDGATPPSNPDTPLFFRPSWSTSGLIAIEFQSDGRGGIKLIDVPAGTEQQILDYGNQPAWSPDEKTIVFTAGMSILEYNVESGSVRSLGTSGRSISPAYSPNGELIAYTSNGGDGSQPPVLWLMSRDGTHHRRIPLPTPRGEMDEADWSPDGTRLIASIADPGGNRLFVTDTLAQDTAYLTPIGMDARFPAWSPDGQEIAYARAQPGEFADLWIMSSDGSNHRRIARNATGPNWRQDGTGLAFVRVKEDGSELWFWHKQTQQFQLVAKAH